MEIPLTILQSLCMLLPEGTIGPIAQLEVRRRNKPVIGWGLGAPAGRGFLKKRRAAFIGQFDALIAYSQRGANEYAALGFPGEKIFVAHNSVSAPPSFPLPERPSTANRQPSILFVGRLQERKRIDILLLACARLGTNPRLVIVGDGPERGALESLARGLYPQAEFVGAKHGAELKPYFLEADLFVLPGTGGLAVQEAMSYGLPVIVAQGDGTQDDLVRQENGWQVPPGNFDALLGAICAACAAPLRNCSFPSRIRACTRSRAPAAASALITVAGGCLAGAEAF